MRPGVAEELGYSDSSNELAWLVLRVIGKLAPCAETSVIAYISGDYTTSNTPTGRVVHNALVKLNALGLVHSTDGQIAVTDIGRQFLDEVPVDPLSPRVRYSLVPTSTTRRQVQQFCQDCARGISQRSFPLIQSTTLVLRQLARQCRKRAEAAAAPVRSWHHQSKAVPRNGLKADGLILRLKFTRDRRSLGVFGGALLVAALATAGGLAFLSSKGGDPTISATEDHAAGHVAEPKTQSLTSRTDTVRIAIQHRLSKFEAANERANPERRAVVDYYSDPTKPLLWVGENGVTNHAQSVTEEVARADDYGLRAADYELPKLDGLSRDSDIDNLAEVEVKISLAVLRYTQDARGARLKPARLSKNLDPTLALPDPLQVMASIAVGDPATYLRSFQPSHPQFEALRQELLALKAEAPTFRPIVTIPEGPALKKGVEHAQVALLRKRLEVSSKGGNENLYGDRLDRAVRRFQMERGVASDGVVGTSTRRALNQQAYAQGNFFRQRLILLNMERWRWLSRDLGPLYVNVNVPDFMARVVKDGETIHTTRVVVGKPSTQTPIFSHKMQEIVFGPYWNVPSSIKVEEIRPYLREETPWFFGGGWNTSVFRRQGLRVRYGGREVDPGAIDWNRVDIRNLEIFQPPGPNNVLGRVKFVFPNKHDVYLHDTTQKHLFAQPVRAESHGCVRVQNPEQLAAILLEYDEGWSAARVGSAMQNGYDQHVPLSHKVPVHITYFTLWVNEDGSMSAFDDLYGHDARMAAALFGDSGGFDYPTNEVRQKPRPRGNPVPWGEATDIVGSIIRFIEN